MWIVWGDGSCGYSIAEFDTFTRFKLPVMALVGNDAGWTQILREQVTILGTEVACKLAVSLLVSIKGKTFEMKQHVFR